MLYKIVCSQSKQACKHVGWLRIMHINIERRTISSSKGLLNRIFSIFVSWLLCILRGNLSKVVRTFAVEAGVCGQTLGYIRQSCVIEPYLVTWVCLMIKIASKL
ncbi:hypothetical protein BDW74DRAFT_70727 [Aspergillus multicolor]|uniref:uncharacterized protein n=1 Tax=Aspergillus multicolor TaxID=41759 RepID=UPI003CCE4B3F